MGAGCKLVDLVKSNLIAAVHLKDLIYTKIPVTFAADIVEKANLLYPLYA